MVLQVPSSINSMKAIKDVNNIIWVAYHYSKPTAFSGYFNEEIEYLTSTDSGSTWSIPSKFTSFKGYDGKLNLQPGINFPLVTFSSNRLSTDQLQKRQIFFGNLGESSDIFTPPFLFKTESSISGSGTYSAGIKAYIDDDSSTLTHCPVIKYMVQKLFL
jgi:hypothetical protein